MIYYFLTALGLVGFLFSSVTDIKSREIPDWLSYSLIIAGLGLRLLFSISENEYTLILFGLVGFGIFFALAHLFYFLRLWGGGDAKLLMVTAALFSTYPNYENISFLWGFLFNLLLIGSVYNLVWAFVLLIKNYDKFKTEFWNLLKHDKFKKYQKYYLVLALVILVFAIIIQDSSLRLTLIILFAVLLVYHYFHILIKAVDHIGMYKNIKVSELTEGDWVAKNIYINKKLIASPKDLGLTKKQINILKKSAILKIQIKQGVPFAPAFLITLIVTLVLGNLANLIIYLK